MAKVYSKKSIKNKKGWVKKMWENVSKPKNPKMERMGRKMVQIIWENFREKNKAKNGKKFARSFATPYCEVMISMR